MDRMTPDTPLVSRLIVATALAVLLVGLSFSLTASGQAHSPDRNRPASAATSETDGEFEAEDWADALSAGSADVSGDLLRAGPLAPCVGLPASVLTVPQPLEFSVSPSDLVSPTRLLMCQARLALQAHSVLTVIGNKSVVAQMSRVLGHWLPEASVTRSVRVSLHSQPLQNSPAVPASPEQLPAASQVIDDVKTVLLAVQLDAEGLMRIYEGFAAPGGEAQATEQFDQWVSEQITALESIMQPLATSPTAQAWTQLSSVSTTYTDSRGTSVHYDVTDYRLNDINSGGDWYLFATQLQTAPNYGGCSYSSVCGPFTTQRNVNLPGSFPLSLSDYGPTGTLTSSTVEFTVGASLTAGTDVGVGVDASYGRSWEQPSVTTTDRSNYSTITAAWQEDFGGPDYSWWPFSLASPPGTSTGSFQSYQAGIFEAPQGTTSYNLTARASSTTAQDYGWHSCNLFFVCWTRSFITVDLSLPLRVQPPVFSVSPSALSLKGGSSGTFNIQAYIPTSSQGLTWNITNIPSWLAVSSLSGNGSRPVSVTVQRKTPIGSVAYLNFNTSPPYAAPSVERGPLVVPVTVVKK